MFELESQSSSSSQAAWTGEPPITLLESIVLIQLERLLMNEDQKFKTSE
jgi:hypothetical protein